MSVKPLLAISAPWAAQLAPARIISGWEDCTSDDVRRYLAAAVKLSQMVNLRLARLQASAHRQGVWNQVTGLECQWFGLYTPAKFDKVRRTFEGIARHLSSRHLNVICGGKSLAYGQAVPFIEKIHLFRAWHYPPAGVDPDAERVQAFIHEASHICGRVSFAELNGSGYGRVGAQSLTAWPMRATRNADNYGYYAIDVFERAATF